MICPTCGDRNSKNFLFCTNCGTELVPPDADVMSPPHRPAPAFEAPGSITGHGGSPSPQSPVDVAPPPGPLPERGAHAEPFQHAASAPFPGDLPEEAGDDFPLPSAPAPAPFPDDIPGEEVVTPSPAGESTPVAPFPDELPEEASDDFPLPSAPAPAPFPGDIPGEEEVAPSPAAGNTLPAPFPGDIAQQQADTAKLPRLEAEGARGASQPQAPPTARSGSSTIPMPNLDAIAAAPSFEAGVSTSRKATSVVPPMARPFVPKAPVVAAARTTCDMCGARIDAGQARCAQCGIGITSSRSAGAQQEGAEARLVHIESDGRAEGAYSIGGDETLFHCASGQPCDKGAYSPDLTATFRHQADSITITAPASMPGVFMRMTPEQPIKLEPGGHFKVGQQLLTFTPSPTASVASWGTISNIRAGRVAQTHVLTGDGAVLGREQADFVFPDDPFASSAHLRIYAQDAGVYIVDLGSTNGSYVKIEGAHPVAPGAVMLIGPRLYRLDA